MSAPLSDITILSIYKNSDGQRLPLPPRMARCTPDMKKAIQEISAALEGNGGHLYLSDLYRTYEMQLQSHMDWVSKKKKAFSPAPGGSLHEAGRAFDLDLSNLNMKLLRFWDLAKAQGVLPIIAQPTPGVSESWHFDCRGSHDIVYQYYKNGNGTNFASPYAAMAASAILTTGVQVDKFAQNQLAAAIQSALIRLGQDIGDMDGDIGPRTRHGLTAVGVAFSSDLQSVYFKLEELLRQRFAEEYATVLAAGVGG
jgi:zinc D-Ala-D-Ala carboxypeptidase